jgi:hypothetical protein
MQIHKGETNVVVMPGRQGYIHKKNLTGKHENTDKKTWNPWTQFKLEHDSKKGQKKNMDNLSSEEKRKIGVKLEKWLKDREALQPLILAGSVDNIDDPIMYRRVLESIYQFCLREHIPLPG